MGRGVSIPYRHEQLFQLSPHLSPGFALSSLLPKSSPLFSSTQSPLDAFHSTNVGTHCCTSLAEPLYARMRWGRHAAAAMAMAASNIFLF